MKINLSKDITFIFDDNEYSGVKKVANMVKNDFNSVFGEGTRKKKITELNTDDSIDAIIYGTLGKNVWINQLIEKKMINLNSLKNKREVYQFCLVPNPILGVKKAICIVGSDKLGTIYGLFHLSEKIGVSPYINWSGILPVKKENVILDETINLISKEPSIRYRGIFINDEWPAFGNWAEQNFGGLNAECYANVFELLLRLKANYLWPAMWRSNFNLDGPGLNSAILADELGIVMSTSHHEPCMRAGEEYSLLRGKDSIYGDSWDFFENQVGISKFWEDGLKRNKNFKNVITLGMRGESDTAIMDHGTMQENIDLIRNVLKEQNHIIKKTVNKNLDLVPRQLVLFTEVENFFYGNDTTTGLIGDPALKGVTLMLSDNNMGYMRTLPTKDMQKHEGGYGMYYHMDMHGGPYSYQWIGSTYLPKIWDQMSTAYDFGVREIWVVNVGDIATQELAMSYFLEMAYDMETYGSSNPNNSEKYTKKWIIQNFGGHFKKSDIEMISEVLKKNYLLLERRKHEIMNDNTYHPTHYGETDELLSITSWLKKKCTYLKKVCPSEILSGFIELIYYPVMGTSNLMMAWGLTTKNHLFAKQNRVITNTIGNQVKNCINFDRQLTKEFHTVANNKFIGLGLSEHFGFTNWNDENNQYPVRHYIEPANKSRLIVSKRTTNEYSIGKKWSRNQLIIDDFMRPDTDVVYLDLACGSSISVHYKINNNNPWLRFSDYGGEITTQKEISLWVDRSMINEYTEGYFSIEGTDSCVTVCLKINKVNTYYPKGTFLENFNYIAMEASHFNRSSDTKNGKFVCLKPYGKTGSAVKVLPHTADFTDKNSAPFLEYHFVTSKSGEYQLQFHFAPSTPVTNKLEQYIGFEINNSSFTEVNTVLDESIPFFLSPQWELEAKTNVKIISVKIQCKKGLNFLKYYQISPNILLERILLISGDCILPDSYLGPIESYRFK